VIIGIALPVGFLERATRTSIFLSPDGLCANIKSIAARKADIPKCIGCHFLGRGLLCDSHAIDFHPSASAGLSIIPHLRQRKTELRALIH